MNQRLASIFASLTIPNEVAKGLTPYTQHKLVVNFAIQSLNGIKAYCVKQNGWSMHEAMEFITKL